MVVVTGEERKARRRLRRENADLCRANAIPLLLEAVADGATGQTVDP